MVGSRETKCDSIEVLPVFGTAMYMNFLASLMSNFSFLNGMYFLHPVAPEACSLECRAPRSDELTRGICLFRCLAVPGIRRRGVMCRQNPVYFVKKSVGAKVKLSEPFRKVEALGHYLRRMSEP